MNELTAHEVNQIIDEQSLLTSNVNISNVSCKEFLTLQLLENKRIHFSRCNFLGAINIYSSSPNTEISFSGCEVINHMEATGLVGKTTFRFAHCKILNGLLISEADNLYLYMGQSSGRGEFVFEGITFWNCQFNQFKFLDSENHNSISFNACAFYSNSFKEAFLVNSTFNGSVFKENAQFDRCTLHYNIPRGTGNFFKVIFEKDAYFNETKFTKGAFFNGAIFRDKAIFAGCNDVLGECIGDFSGVQFLKRVFFDNAKFKDLILENAEFKEIVSFKYMHCGSIKLSKCIFSQSADFLDAEILNASRESLRMIKHECSRNNDLVLFTIYQARELTAHYKDITWKGQPQEKFALWINSISNAYGLSWWKGVRFTFWVTVGFYLFYLLSLGKPPGTFGWAGWQSFYNAVIESIEFFPKFFIITHDLDFMNKFKPSFCSYLIDTFARIFIAYGIYQTVQAFRKYGKN